MILRGSSPVIVQGSPPGPTFRVHWGPLSGPIETHIRAHRGKHQAQSSPTFGAHEFGRPRSPLGLISGPIGPTSGSIGTHIRAQWGYTKAHRCPPQGPLAVGPLAFSPASRYPPQPSPGLDWAKFDCFSLIFFYLKKLRKKLG